MYYISALMQMNMQQTSNNNKKNDTLMKMSIK